MRRVFVGLAALSLLFLISFAMPNNVVIPALDDVAIVAPAADLGPTTQSGVVVTANFDEQSGLATSRVDPIITDGRIAKWGYGAHTARQFVVVRRYRLNFDETDYTNDAGTRPVAEAADPYVREAGWTPGAHTERLHRLGEFLNA